MVEKITQITRYGTVLIAALQGYGVSVGLENAGNLVIEPGMSFRVITTISLVAGTPFNVEETNSLGAWVTEFH